MTAADNRPRPQDPAKFRRYRERMKARGLKQVRLWVYDPEAPGSRERLDAEIERINDAEDAADVQIFMDLCAQELWDIIDAEERAARR